MARCSKYSKYAFLPLPFIRGRAMAEGPVPKFHAISAGKCSVVGMIEPGSFGEAALCLLPGLPPLRTPSPRIRLQTRILNH